MLKKDITRTYKKGTEVKLPNTMEETDKEVRGHIVGYWQMPNKGWGIEVLLVGEETVRQLDVHDIVRVYSKEENFKKQESNPAPKKKAKAKPVAPAEVKVIDVQLGEDVDEVTGEVIKKGEKIIAPVKTAIVINGSIKVGEEGITLDIMRRLAMCDSVSGQIRVLLLEGKKRTEVAKLLGVNYRYVYAIEHKTLKRKTIPVSPLLEAINETTT